MKILRLTANGFDNIVYTKHYCTATHRFQTTIMFEMRKLANNK